MNHTYRSIWNASTGTVTAVSEQAKSRGKQSSGGKRAVVRLGFILQAVSAALALSYGSAGYASPAGGTVVAGNASINIESGRTTILQTTQNAALTWQSFDIGIAESVQFVQPNSNSVALNRVSGSDPSSILGSLAANGKVFLVNPNGILFGTGAQVNVGGLVASTRDIADSDFMAGRYEFNGSGNRGVVNLGSIHADGGYVALLGANVSNQGVIVARMGSVALASGNALTIDVAGDGLLNVTVNAGAVDALVHNGGIIQVDAGQVVLTARSAGTLLHSAVNNTGVIQAQTIENRNGTIRLLGDMDSGSVAVAGTLDASAPHGGDGGFIDTSAANVNVANDAKVTTAAAQGQTGSWLIDPTDYNIAASGGNITGAALSSNLASTNVTVLSSAGNSGTAGDVNVNDTVTWSVNKLTLNAQNNININTAMNGSGTASLALQYGQGAVAAGNTGKVNVNAPVSLPAGNNFSTLQGSNGSIVNYTVITSLGAAGSATGTDLQGMSGNLARNYVLGANIDAAVTSTWNAGAGFAPIGNDPTRFAGIFDGLGHTVSGLYINRTGSNFTGMFGYTAAGSMIRNMGLIGGSVTSDMWGTGSLIGSLAGTVMNSYATGSVRGFQTAGGLVGVIDGGAIVDSHATGDVVGYGNGEAGGLVGLIWGGPPGTVTNSYATGNVSSPVGNVGGLVGINWGTVTGSHATGTASGTDYIGGLIGNNSNGSFSNSYATGAVTGNNRVGGLAGNNSNSITNSYATGAVTGSASVGGAVGSNYGTLGNSYATGNVTGVLAAGGLIGTNRSTVSNSFATGNVTGGDQVAGLVGGHQNGSITNSHATGNVTATTGAAGGLVGYSSAPISSSYASGSVTGVTQVGGLLGAMNGSTITNSYSTSAVAGIGNVGGLVGNSSNGTITNTYSAGAVSGTTNVGGLLGSRTGATVTNGYWDLTTSGQPTSAGGTGLTTGQMQTAANFTGFTFTTTGGAAGNNWVMVNLDGSLNSGLAPTRPMLAIEYSTTINSAHQLQLMVMDLAASYTLGRNIDAAATGTAGDVWIDSTFIPVGQDNARFTGTLNGLGHTIANLRIELPGAGSPGFGSLTGADESGLFGHIGSAGIVQNIGLVGGSVVGRDFVGGLAGQSAGTVTNSYASGAVQGRSYVGGLIGNSVASGTTSGSHATGAVTGSLGSVGGLIGRNDGAASGNYATGAVQGGEGAVGGLVGFSNGSVGNSYASGTVTGVNGSSYVGGLVGRNYGSVSNSYATGAVQGFNYVGGLLGGNYGSVTNTYATGAVQSANAVGGLMGTNYGSVTDSFWDIETSGQSSSGAGGGLTTAQMMQLSSFSSWNTSTPNTIASTGHSGASWRIYEGHTAPLLTQFLTALTVTDNVVVTYNGSAQSGMSVVPGGVLGATATNAGVYTFYSDQQGFDLTGGLLTINTANLILSGTRAYDGTTAFAGNDLIATGVAGESFAVSGSGHASNLTSRNVQTGSTLSTVSGLALGAGLYGGIASNYDALSTTGSSVSITRIAITLASADVIKTYDGTMTAAGSATVVGGALFGADAISGGTFAFTDKNAGIGDKTVTTAGVIVDDGNSGGNYTVTYANNTTSTIDRAVLTVVGQVAEDKAYDGTTAATLRGGALAGVVAGDAVMLGEAGIFASADVGNAIAVTATDSLSGIAAANYTLTQPVGLTANIIAVNPPVVPPEVIPPVVVTPPVDETPPADETPPVTVPPPPVDPAPPQVTVTATVAYISAVGHVTSSSQITPLQSNAPARSVAAPSVPPSGGPAITYDLSGLNLTVVPADAGLSVAPSEPIREEDDRK